MPPNVLQSLLKSSPSNPFLHPATDDITNTLIDLSSSNSDILSKVFSGDTKSVNTNPTASLGNAPRPTRGSRASFDLGSFSASMTSSTLITSEFNDVLGSETNSTSGGRFPPSLDEFEELAMRNSSNLSRTDSSHSHHHEKSELTSQEKSPAAFGVFTFDDDNIFGPPGPWSCPSSNRGSSLTGDDVDSDALGAVDSGKASSEDEDDADNALTSGMPLIPIGSPSNRTLAIADRLKISTESLSSSRDKINKCASEKNLSEHLSTSQKSFDTRRMSQVNINESAVPMLRKPPAVRPRDLSRIMGCSIESLPELGSSSVTNPPEVGYLGNRKYQRSCSKIEYTPREKEMASPVKKSSAECFFTSTPSFSPKSQEHQSMGASGSTNLPPLGSLPDISKTVDQKATGDFSEYPDLGPVGFFDLVPVPSLRGLLKSKLLQKMRSTQSFDKLDNAAWAYEGPSDKKSGSFENVNSNDWALFDESISSQGGRRNRFGSCDFSSIELKKDRLGSLPPPPIAQNRSSSDLTTPSKIALPTANEPKECMLLDL